MQNTTNFKSIQDQPNFINFEHDVLAYWKEIDAFKKQLELTKDCKPFTFYDGPPFATGLPHYGNLLAGTIKDVVCRYASQTGHFVARKWGWDCHGLPIEYEIDKKHKINSRKDVLDMGIEKYNGLCRGIVMTYSEEWKKIVERYGRWIDMENDYKTMDLKFMESVWYVFKQIFNKGLVYRGYRIMPYSNRCSTVLSNFETQQNYQEITDPAIFITFPLVKDPETSLVAWTTTPWTLPSNLSVTVHPELIYCKIEAEGKKLIVAECRLASMYKSQKDYKIIEKYVGKDLEGQQYIPLFNYFYEDFKETAFRITCDTYVTTDTGTGLVHSAPGFGEDDYRVCTTKGIIKPDQPPVPLDLEGFFTDKVSDFKGMYVKDADKDIKKFLKQNGRLLRDGQIKHNYPFCWRSDTPLIYKAVASWFIKVTDIKDDLVKNNFAANWVPKDIQEGRFNNWLENARDWCFSRNRFWGNPIPIWASEDFQEVICIGSVQELVELSGYKGEITDLHRESIDHITIPSKQGKGVLRRIEEVFDCWFESGAMPYGQVHYPFSTNEEQFSKIFPADFIAEGIDQTRGWFYTLNVISTAVKNSNPYKNLIVNGIVQAADGKKMSKSKGNYTPLAQAAEQFGADAIRLYIINSALVRGQSLNFKDQGVQDVQKNVFLPWYNGFKMLAQAIQRIEQQTGKPFEFDSTIVDNKDYLTNVMDYWITISSHNLTKLVRTEMESYRLYSVIPKILDFLENLNNWYIKLNRSRIRGEKGEQEAQVAVNVLFNAILRQTILMSPLIPLLTEYFYQDLKKCIKKDSPYKQESIHFVQIPQYNADLIDEQIEISMKNMQEIIFYGRKIRIDNSRSVKYPVKKCKIYATQETINGVKPLVDFITGELNTAEIELIPDTGIYSEKVLIAEHKTSGKLFGKEFQKFLESIKTISKEDIAILESQNKLSYMGKEIELNNHVYIQNRQKTENLKENEVIQGNQNLTVLLDLTHDEQLFLKGIAREFTSLVQKQRKNSGMVPTDKVILFYSTKTEKLSQAIQQEKLNLVVSFKKPLVCLDNLNIGYLKQFDKVQLNNKFDDEEFDIVFTYESIKLNPEVQKREDYPLLEKAIRESNHTELLEKGEKEQALTFKLENNTEVTLKLNQDYSIGWN